MKVYVITPEDGMTYMRKLFKRKKLHRALQKLVVVVLVTALFVGIMPLPARAVSSQTPDAELTMMTVLCEFVRSALKGMDMSKKTVVQDSSKNMLMIVDESEAKGTEYTIDDLVNDVTDAQIKAAFNSFKKSD